LGERLDWGPFSPPQKKGLFETIMHSKADAGKTKAGVRALHLIVWCRRKFGVGLGALAFSVLGASMRRILFVALAFVVLFHLIQIAATGRTRRVERPFAVRTTPSLDLSIFDPCHHSHKSFLGLELSSRARQFCLHGETQFVLVATRLKLRRRRNRLPPARSGTRFRGSRLRLSIVPGRLV